MAVEYTLSFSSDTGANIEYELDILRESYSGVAKALKGQASPITIQWKKDRNVYSPILGSKASINLLVEEGDSLTDFNDAAPFTYEVRLRYKDSGDNLQDVWKGWIDPNDGEERVGSYPYPVSFVATDGFANLESAVRMPEDRGQVSLLHYILYCLEQTGLGLDIRIDSSIIDSDSNDMLSTVTVDELAFISSNTDEVWPQNADSRLDVLSGILQATNCSVRQANGKWYIFNNSLHGGTGDNETNTWKAYEYDSGASDKIDGTNYRAIDDVTENLLYTLDSSSSTDLYVKGESLYLNPRYPYGSVEVDFQNLRAKQLAVNPRFDNGTTGWIVHPDSIDQTLTRNVTGGVNGASLTTNRLRENSASNSDIWFETDVTEAVQMSRGFPHELKFHWYAERSGGSAEKVRLKYQMYAEFTESVTQERVIQGLSFNFIDWIFGNPIQVEDRTSNRIYVDHRDNGWELNPDGDSFSSYYSTTAENNGFGYWQEETLDIRRIGNYVRALGSGTSLPDEQPKFFIRFMYPEGIDKDDDKVGNSTGNVTTYVDNISVLPVYEGDDADPTFERAQSNYTTTLSYKPNVYSDTILEQQFFEQLSESDYWESGQTPTDQTARTLEQIVTNQKLKDWKDQFYYYECTFVNNNPVPIAQHNKIKLGLTDHNVSTTLIQNGGSFDPKMNTYKVGMYVPNQTGGEDFGDFTRYNIELVGVDPPVRDTDKTVVISYNYETVDDDGNTVEVEDSEGREPGDTGYVSTAAINSNEKWTIATGRPGSVVQRSVLIQPSSEYEIDGIVELLDTDDKPAPTYMRGVAIERLGSFVEVTFNIEIPEEDEYEEAYFKATVDELVGDNSKVILDADGSGLVNANIEQGGGDITEIGPIGSTERFLYYITPSATYQMNASDLTVTLNSVKDGDSDSDTDVPGVINASDIDVIQAGTGCIVSIPFKYVETSPVYAKLTFSGTATTIPASDTVQLQVKATEGGSDTDNWSITDSDITLTGIPGTPVTFYFEVNPESGRAIPTGNISLSSLDESGLGTYAVTGTGDLNSEAIVLLEATFPTEDKIGDDAYEITINATTTTGLSTETLKSYGITWTAPANTTVNNSGSGVTLQLDEGQTALFVLSLEANTGYNLGNIAIDEDNLPDGMSYEGRTDYGDLDEVEISDFRFLITGQAADDTGNAIPFTSDGVAGEANQKYTLLVNINTDDESVNADTDKKQIRIPFGLADVGEAITSQTFKIYSSESQVEYSATGDVSFTVTSSSDNDAVLACSATSIADGVITATITGNLPDDTLPEDGIAEVDITVGGAAAANQAATIGELFWGPEVSSSQVYMNREDTYFKIRAVTNGKWARTVEFSSNGSTYSTYVGTHGTQDSDKTLGYIFVQTFANNTGADRYYRIKLHPQGDTDTTLDTMIVRQRGDYEPLSPDIKSIRVVTQTEFDALSGTDSDNVLYLIEQ